MSARFSANEPGLFVGSTANPAGVASSPRIADDPPMADDVPKLTADERAAIVRVLQRSLETARFPLSPRLAPLRSALVKLDKPTSAPLPERMPTVSEQSPAEPRPALYRTQTRKAHWLPIVIGIPVLIGLIAAAIYGIDRWEQTAHAVPATVPAASPLPAPTATPPASPAAATPSTAATPAASATPTPRFIVGIPTAQPPAPPAAPPSAAPPSGPTPNLATGIPPITPPPPSEAPAAAPPPPEAEAPAVAPRPKHPRAAAPPPSGQVRF